MLRTTATSTLCSKLVILQTVRRHSCHQSTRETALCLRRILPTMRPRPNILVTGTPGVGKSTFCRQLARETGLEHIELSRLVEEEHLYTERDLKRGCSIFDEELVLSKIEDMIHEGNKLVDFHSCDFFPEDWFDLICVLRADTEKLYDRLKNRHYDQDKIGENVQCEIFRVLLDEALDTFGEDNIRELSSNTPEELNKNVETVITWLREWGASDT